MGFSSVFHAKSEKERMRELIAIQEQIIATQAESIDLLMHIAKHAHEGFLLVSDTLETLTPAEDPTP